MAWTLNGISIFQRTSPLDSIKTNSSPLLIATPPSTEAIQAILVGACQDHIAAGRPFAPLFNTDVPLEEKALRIATRLYGADGINIRAKAHRQLKEIESWGYGKLPICMAKTQYSFSHDASLLGAPTGFEVPIREFRLNAGAGFVVAVLGEIMTMPGLPERPAAADMDMDEDGNLVGVFG